MRPLAYETLVDRSGGTPAFKARLTCRACGAHGDLAIGQHKHNPERVAQKFRDRGWAATTHVAAKVRCPECSASVPKRAPPADMQPAPHQPVTKMEQQPMTKETRQPTQDQRLAIRNLLDRHFDDKAGCYIDGYSDQMIGKEAGVPWAMVTTIREAAYGPIRQDAGLGAVEKNLAEAKALLSKAGELVAGAERALLAQKARLGMAG